MIQEKSNWVSDIIGVHINEISDLIHTIDLLNDLTIQFSDENSVMINKLLSRNKFTITQKRDLERLFLYSIHNGDFELKCINKFIHINCHTKQDTKGLIELIRCEILK